MEITLDSLPARTWEHLCPAPALQQSWSYGAACAALGSRVLRFRIMRGRETVGLAQAIHRRVFGLLDAVVCTRGPVWLDAPDAATRAEALDALRRALPFGRLRGLFLTPDGDAGEDAALQGGGFQRVMTAYSTAVLDLTRPPDALRAAMHQKWRNRLVAAERAGLEIRRADRRPRLYHWLLDAEQTQQRARRYRALPPALVSAWQEAGGGVHVLTAGRDGTTEAAMLFLIHGQRATYHLGWAGTEGKRLNAHNLLLWRAMTDLPRRGVAELDLGGLNTEDIPGIARFKLGSGARLRTLCGTWFGR